jgi:hypothetical protein
MKALITSAMILLLNLCISGQTQSLLALNKEYANITIDASESIFNLQLVKGGIYKFSILQQGVAVYYLLTDIKNVRLYESNYPDDFVGYEQFEYAATVTGKYKLIIKRFNDPLNPPSGKITIHVKSLEAKEIELRNKIKKELEEENAKNVQTVDIDHFWQAFDSLRTCVSLQDSINTFQKIYLDRATNGLMDFIQVRELTAEKLTKAVATNAEFYREVRSKTYEAKKSGPLIEQVFARFKELFPQFRPFKVCFLIGMKNTGGTVSNDFVLIGTEVTTSIDDSKDILQKIKSIVAHECVHTQQRPHPDTNAVICDLLYKVLKEGSCDFIGEMVSGNPKHFEYGDQHEEELWKEFKLELCSQNIEKWLYNGSRVKDRPADLGYFIGYKISKAYYNNAKDKNQAIVDLIELRDPLQILEQSEYDKRINNN